MGSHLALALAHALLVEAPATALGGRSGDLPAALLVLAGIAGACFASGHLAAAARHRRWRDLIHVVGLATVAYATAIALEGAALTVAWAVEAAGLWRIAHRDDDPVTAQGAPALLAGALGHALVALAPPVALLDGLAEPASAAVALGACAVAAWIMAQAPSSRSERRTGLLATAGITGLYLASVELVTPFGPGAGTDPQALLSGLWALIGVVALLVGLVRDRRALRLAALALLGATVVKVFLYDLAALTSLARVGSFIALGLLLLAGAFAWQRLRPGEGPPAPA